MRRSIKSSAGTERNTTENKRRQPWDIRVLLLYFPRLILFHTVETSVGSASTWYLY
uniref:Uncharacterized protein n=1 Tax=Roseihalotalea indica TaxID=2867963 RepID=A0AA49Q0F6_9BACT|nr:hypothetical protein K4G66_15590 [Tunicatimonas sp. TK19036]